jgi:HK97 gp10 family phage protein
MTQSFSFAAWQAAIARAAARGAADAADALAVTLRTSGESVRVQSNGDGSVRVVLEGAAAVAREFGTQASPAQPLLSPAVQDARGRIVTIVSNEIRAALNGKRP